MTPPGCCKSYTDTTPSLSDFQENIREFHYNTDKAITTTANGNKIPRLVVIQGILMIKHFLDFSLTSVSSIIFFFNITQAMCGLSCSYLDTNIIM